MARSIDGATPTTEALDAPDGQPVEPQGEEVDQQES